MSRGYLRHFGTDDRVWLCDKISRSARLVGTNDVFVSSNFNSVLTADGVLDDLEEEWSGVEGQILPAVRRLLLGDGGVEARAAAKVLAALHLVRSYGFAEIAGRLQQEYGERAPVEIASNQSVQRAFEADYKRRAEPGEIEAHVTRQWDEAVASNRFRVDRMVSIYNQLVDHVAGMSVQVLRQNAVFPSFIAGEIPAVHFDRSGLRLGLRSGLAYLEADHIYMPLSPTTAIMLTTRDEGDLTIAPFLVRWMNSLVWRAADRFVVCHAGDDPKDLVGCKPVVSRRQRE